MSFIRERRIVYWVTEGGCFGRIIFVVREGSGLQRGVFVS